MKAPRKKRPPAMGMNIGRNRILPNFKPDLIAGLPASMIFIGAALDDEPWIHDYLSSPDECRLALDCFIDRHCAFKMVQYPSRPGEFVVWKLRVVFRPFRLVSRHWHCRARIVRVVKPTRHPPRLGIKPDVARGHQRRPDDRVPYSCHSEFLGLHL